MTISSWGTTIIMVLATLLVIAGLAWGEEHDDEGAIDPWHASPQAFLMNDDEGAVLLRITAEGEINLSATPTDAARAFIEALQGELAQNQACRQLQHDLLQELWSTHDQILAKTVQLARKAKIRAVLEECKTTP
jgi:hypothetical protein